MPTEMPLGKCPCRAVYAFDVTGHNLGTALIEALVFACDGDWDLAWDLLPDEDYTEALVHNYDMESHLLVHGAHYQGRRIAGTLYFIRLLREVPVSTREPAQSRPLKAPLVSEGRSTRRGRGKAFSKRDVERWVRDYDLVPLLSCAEKDKRILRDLQRLLYSADKLMRWKAADVVGRVSAIIAAYDPAAVSGLLQRLFSALEDTAASSWGSLDAIGEIISHNPEQFVGYLPRLYPLMGDRALLSQVLRALGLVGARRPDLLKEKSPHFLPLLLDPDPQIRGHATILLGNLGATEAMDNLARLLDDTADMEIYSAGQLLERTVGQLASKALEKWRRGSNLNY